jgi:2OG-Fe(II) oxygenase superfamily
VLQEEKMIDAPIKVIKNFVSEEELQTMIEYIDLLEGTISDKFIKWQENKRLALQFGVDFCHPKSSHSDLQLLSDREKEIDSYFFKVIEAMKITFDVRNELYMSSFWLAKQYPGAVVGQHEDTDSGYNMHYKYSAVLYLNTMVDGGELIFYKYDYRHKPAAGDLVLFPSQETGMHAVEEISEVRYSLVFWMTDDQSLSIVAATRKEDDGKEA